MRILLGLTLLLAACSDQAPAPAASRPATAAEAATETPPESGTELRDGIQAPIDRAKAVEQSTLDDAEKQRQDIEDAGG